MFWGNSKIFRAAGTTKIDVLLHFTNKFPKFGAFGPVTLFEAFLEIVITITKLCQFYIIVKEYNSTIQKSAQSRYTSKIPPLNWDHANYSIHDYKNYDEIFML